MTTTGPSPRVPSAADLLRRLRKGLGRIRRSFGINTFDVFARPVTPEDARFEAPEGYRFAWATPEDIAGCDTYHTELDEAERAAGVRRLEFGHRAVVAFSGEQVVFSMWVNPRNLNTPGELKRRLAPDQEFIYKAFTSPDHRGRKLYQAGMRFVLADMAARGLTELIGYAHVKKTVSRAGLDRLGFYSKGRYHVVFGPGLHRVILTRELRESFPEAVPPSGVLAAAPTRS